jgi:hypothetical protein
VTLLTDAATVAAENGKSRVTAKTLAVALDTSIARRAAAGNAAPAAAPADDAAVASAMADAAVALQSSAANANDAKPVDAKPVDAKPVDAKPVASASKPVATPRPRAVFSANKRSVFCGTERIAVAETVTDAIILARVLNAAQPTEYVPADDSNVVSIVKPVASKPDASTPVASKPVAASIDVAF